MEFPAKNGSKKSISFIWFVIVYPTIPSPTAIK